MGKDWDKTLPDKEIFKECFRILKPGAFACIMSAPRTDVYWRMCQMIEEAGFQVNFTPIVWSYSSGFPKAANAGKMLDKKNGTEREILGVSPAQRLNKPENDIYEAGIRGKECFETKGSSILEGSFLGFQPKPAIEMIIVCMKPIECKTYLEQALKNGHGISWLDDCRIPYETGEDIREGNMEESKPANIPAGCAGGTIKSGTGNPQGRFPANLLVSLDSLNDFKIHKGQQGSTTGKEPSVDKNGNCYGDYSGVSNPHIALGDKGSYSRYFDLDKWAEGKNIYETQFMITPKASKSEKNKGCDEGVEKDIGHNRFDKCETCGKYILQNQDRPSACKCENPIRKNNVISGNFHPTVKPVKLMSYLITMFSREGDVIVDPFCGSGTTGVASKKLKRNFIGIDITPEYIEIAKTRINAEGKENIEAVINKTVDDKGNVKEIIRKYEQPRLFDESK